MNEHILDLSKAAEASQEKLTKTINFIYTKAKNMSFDDRLISTSTKFQIAIEDAVEANYLPLLWKKDDSPESQLFNKHLSYAARSILEDYPDKGEEKLKDTVRSFLLSQEGEKCADNSEHTDNRYYSSPLKQGIDVNTKENNLHLVLRLRA